MTPRPTRRPPVQALPVALARLGLLVVSLTLMPLGSPPALAAPDVGSVLAKADRRLDKGDYRRAASLYAKADRAAEGQSLPALVGLARASVRAGDYGETIAAARRWQQLDGSPESRAGALFFEGLGHYWQGMTARWRAIGENYFPVSARTGKIALPGDPALDAAVHAFRAGLAAFPESNARASTLLFLADVLVERGELDPAAEALAAYAEVGGDDRYADNLRCWVDQFRGAPVSDATAPGVTPPEKIYAPFPQYTQEARAARAEGSMMLKMAVTAQGDVQCLRVIRGLPFGMVQSVTETVLQWRFRPALLDGQPLPVHYFLSINFELR